MKKILLSSIIMLGVCGVVNAQNETGSKFKKNNTTTSAAAPTPQKAAVMPATDLVAPTTTDAVPSDVRTAADKQAAATAPAPAKTKAQVRAEQAAAAAAVNADGTAMTAEQKEKAAKIEAEKAQNVKQNQQ